MLSTSVAEAFGFEKNSDTSETERFVRTFDKFFDLMNVRSLKEGEHKRKPNLNPYRKDRLSEEHLQVRYTYSKWHVGMYMLHLIYV